MKRVAKLMPEAIAGFDLALAYYKHHSPAGAARWLGAFEAVIDQIEAEATRFPIADIPGISRQTLHYADFGTRPAKPTHRLIYTIAGDEVRILVLRHHAQDVWRS